MRHITYIILLIQSYPWLNSKKDVDNLSKYIHHIKNNLLRSWHALKNSLAKSSNSDGVQKDCGRKSKCLKPWQEKKKRTSIK